MTKKLLGLIMVLGISISCSKINKKTNVLESNQKATFFRNDTIKFILENIILENRNIKNLNIDIIDEENQTLLIFKEIDSIYNCDGFKGVYNYGNIRMFLFNHSKKVNYDEIINAKLNTDSCQKYLAKFYNIIDTEEYVYKIDKDANVHYPNGEKLIYKDGILKLKFWRENKQKTQPSFGELNDKSFK